MRIVSVKFGNIGEERADLVVVPCSGKPKWRDEESKSTQDRIDQFNLPSPIELVTETFPEGKTGTITQLIKPKKDSHLCKYVVFAATSLGRKSHQEKIFEIGERLGRLTQEHDDINFIEAPFLGCGYGGLNPDQAIPALALGFLKARHENAVLRLRRDDHSLVELGNLELEKILARHEVLLIHGMRTEASWQEEISELINEEEINFIRVKYGFFNFLLTLCPLTRGIAIKKVIREYDDLRASKPNVRISAIGHSFGSYILAKALKKRRDIKFHRLIFCGGVIPANFRVADFRDQIDQLPIRNDCGWKDIIPVLAQSSALGFGATGRYGFGTMDIEDQYHDFGHSGYLNPEFASKYWVPFIKSGSFEKDGLYIQKKRTPLFVSWLGMRGFIYPLLVFAAWLVQILVQWSWQWLEKLF